MSIERKYGDVTCFIEEKFFYNPNKKKGSLFEPCITCFFCSRVDCPVPRKEIVVGCLSIQKKFFGSLNSLYVYKPTDPKEYLTTYSNNSTAHYMACS